MELNARTVKHMMMTDDIEKLDRVRELPCKEIEGRPFYRFRDVCMAMNVPSVSAPKVSRRIEPEHKRYVWQKKRTRTGKVYSDKRFLYIDRAGVERIVLRYGGTISRHEWLDALPLP